jgi:ankyrin repeat protein
MDMQQQRPLSGNLQAKEPAKLKADILPSERPIMSIERQKQLNDALIDAARHGQNTEMLRLIGLGASTGAGDEVGRTALHWAALNGNDEACALLMDEFVKTGKEIWVLLLASKNEFGNTALHDAAAEGRTQTCALIIGKYAKLGGNPNELIAATNKESDTSLHKSAWFGHAKTCALLMQEYASRGGNAKEFIAAQNKELETSLHKAAYDGHSQACIALMREYAKAGGSIRELIAIKDRAGDTAIYFAAINRHTKTVQFLKSIRLLQTRMGKEAFNSFMASYWDCVFQ